MVQPAPSVTATFIRGGTSKALFFHEKDIPAPGPARDEFLIRVMGSPDASQIDGMGGAKIVTSKVAIVRPSARPDADVDYTFAQVGLGEVEVDYEANCGNISAGVGPFAINEGLLKTENWYEGKRTVRIFNTGKRVILVAHVPVDDKTGRALEKGDYSIYGCPGTGAPILMDYSQTAQENSMLPSGNVIDQLECTFGTVQVTYCEVGNAIAFVDARALGIQGDETVPALDGNKQLIDRVREVRGRMAQNRGMCEDWHKVDEQSPLLPMVALVSPPTVSKAHIQSRLFLDNHCHPSMAGTGSVCTATISRIEGSVVNQLLAPGATESTDYVIQHPSGFLRVATETKGYDGKLPDFKILGFQRTARYLFQGQLFVPVDIQDDMKSAGLLSALPVPGDALDQQVIGHPTSAPKQKRSDVTQRLAAFTRETTFEDLSPDAVQRLKQCLLDFLGVAVMGAKAGESSPVFLKGIEASTVGFPATHTVLGTNKKFPAQYAAFLNSAYAHTLDFDDTHTDGIIHVGVTIFGALLAEAQDHPNLTYKSFLAAAGVGYEVSCRISLALGVSSWHRGFHNTSIAGIFGAVAALCKIRDLSTHQIQMAFGIAVSFASGSMQYLQNGSWNKRMHPAKAAHDSFIVVAMAQEGVLGAAQPIEGHFGLIAAHTDTPNAEVDVRDLGQRWELVNTGLKPYPACRVTHTSIELANLLSSRDDPTRKVKSMKIFMDPAPFPIVGVAAPNKVHPDNVVDAQFSAFFQAAASWVCGDNLGWAIYDHVSDEAVQELCGKITIESKVQDTKNDLVTTMEVTWEDGETKEMTLQYPKWQEPQRPVKDAEVATKFKSLAATVLGTERVASVIAYVTGGTSPLVSDLAAHLS